MATAAPSTSSATAGERLLRRYGAIERLIGVATVVFTVEQLARIEPLHRLTVIVWLCAVATMFLTPRARLHRSWPAMWVAAVASFVISILGMFSIGAFIFVLTCVQLGAVFALRRGWSRRGLMQAMLGGALVWVLVVPVQLAGFKWLWGFGIYQVVGLAGLLATLLPLGRPRPLRTAGAG